MNLSRPTIQQLRGSKIREVANAGMGIADVLPFWFGEPDEVTPEFIRNAAAESLARGETFYSHNLGIIELRETIAAYMSRLHGNTSPNHIAVSSSGVSALMLIAQAIIEPGDHVVAVTPLWPNVVEIPRILGASVTCVPLEFSERGWQLDVNKLLAAAKLGTRAIIINSPNNPTGWTISAGDQRAVLDHCRKHGIWIIADDAYERLYYGSDASIAPSFLSIADREERVVSAHTFSKSWLMTGWRLGWIVAPQGLMDGLGKLIEYNTSCSPVFVQRAGIAAITGGDGVIERTRTRFKAARDHLCVALDAISGVHAPPPPGAMYAFFRVDGLSDSLAFCKRLVKDAHLGLAPGIAFGPEGEGYVRWCFASSHERLDEGIARFKRGLAR